MTSRISEKFKQLGADKRKALVIFITAGDPSINATVKMAISAHSAGADIIELGVPFSDPLADGPVIQESFHRSIKNGTNLTKTFAGVKQIRVAECEAPIILMLASTLVFNYGVAKFMKQCALCGVDGLILPDIPPEESDDILPYARKAGLDMIFLAAPTSTSKRLKKIARLTTGFLYYINITGVTGKKKAAPKEVGSAIRKIRKVTKSIPVCAGFGITNAEQAREISRHADGVIIGTEAIRVIDRAGSSRKAIADLADFVRSIRNGLDS